MPGNIIKINDYAEFYVGDSKMEELILWLVQNARCHNEEAKKMGRETLFKNFDSKRQRLEFNIKK